MLHLNDCFEGLAMRKVFLLCTAWLLVGANASAMESKIIVREGQNSRGEEYIEAIQDNGTTDFPFSHKMSERLTLYETGVLKECDVSLLWITHLLSWPAQKLLPEALREYIKVNKKGEKWEKLLDKLPSY